MTFFKSSKKTHRHKFLDKLENQLAIWSKRDCPDDGVYFRGLLRQCWVCGAYRFRPNDSKLREVDVMR